MLRLVFFLLVTGIFLLSCGNEENASPASATAPADTILQSNPAQKATGNGAAAPDTTRSLAVLEKQHAMVPSDPALAYELAFAYAEQKNAKALQLADSLIKAGVPEVEKAYYSKATYYAASNNLQEAVKNYNAAIGANYHFLDAYFDKGRLLYDQKQYEEALKSFALGQKMSPGTAEFYFWVAKSQEALGQKADAKMNYERAYALDKGMMEAKEAAERL